MTKAEFFEIAKRHGIVPKKATGVEWCALHTTIPTGKLEGLIDFSISARDIVFCNNMHDKCGTICENCYAFKALNGGRKNVHEALQVNKMMMERILEDWELPRINAKRYPIVRFNSWGDLANETHMFNLVRICELNPNVKFGLWTKRPNIVQTVLNETGKPKNLSLVYSSPKKNVRGDLPSLFDHVFTVYEKDVAKGNMEKINCRDENLKDKKCITCQLCYNSTTVHIGEKLK